MRRSSHYFRQRHYLSGQKTQLKSPTTTSKVLHSCEYGTQFRLWLWHVWKKGFRLSYHHRFPDLKLSQGHYVCESTYCCYVMNLLLPFIFPVVANKSNSSVPNAWDSPDCSLETKKYHPAGWKTTAENLEAAFVLQIQNLSQILLWLCWLQGRFSWKVWSVLWHT